MYEVMFFDMKKYMYPESLFNALDIEIKYKLLQKISFGQNKRYKKCTRFSFASSKSSQFQWGFEPTTTYTVLLLIRNS